MKFGFDLNQASTVRGIVMFITGLTAIGSVFTGNGEYVGAIIGGGITVAGALGVGIKDIQ